MYGITSNSFLNSIGVRSYSNNFYVELNRMLSQKSTGKSGSFFFYTADRKYLIKTIKHDEKNVLI